MDKYTEKLNRHILLIDDNEAIHDDYRKILSTLKTDTQIDELENDLFSDDDDDINADEKPQTIAPHEVIEYEIESAYQGKEAYEMVLASIENENPYALAFVDMRMPPGGERIAQGSKRKSHATLGRSQGDVEFAGHLAQC